MSMEQALVPVIVQETTSQVVDHTVRNACLVAGGIILVGAATAGIVWIATREKNTAVSALANKAATLACAELDEVEKLRAAAVSNATATARAEAAKKHPHALLDDPMSALVALTAINKN